MFKFDLSTLVSNVSDVLTAGDNRKCIKSEDVVIALAKRGFVLATDKDGDLHIDNAVKVLKGFVALTTVFTCEVGRSGGIGLTEWESEEKEVSATSALKRSLIDLGIERGEATKAVNRYVADLISGKAPLNLTPADVLKRYT